MEIVRLFQFTLMTCHLPYAYQNYSKNEPKKFIFQAQKKDKYNQFFVTISENRVYCNNKPTNYQIWCMLVFITTFVCVRLSQKQEEKNAVYQIFLSSFLRLFKIQCSSIVNEKFEYYSFASIMFIVDQLVYCGLLWFNLPRKVSWTL